MVGKGTGKGREKEAKMSKESSEISKAQIEWLQKSWILILKNAPHAVLKYLFFLNVKHSNFRVHRAF